MRKRRVNNVVDRNDEIADAFDPRPVYQAAVEALNRGDWRHAAELAHKLLQHLPEHAGVQFVAGVAAMNLQQMPQSLQHL